MRLFSYATPYRDPPEVFAPFAHEPYALLLDSADSAHPDARYSFIAVRPRRLIEASGDIFAQAQVELKQSNFAPIQEGLPPFQGGVAGFFAYDGPSQLALYDTLIAFNHAEKESWILVQAENEDTAFKKYDSLKSSSLQLPEAYGRCEPLEWQSNFTQSEYEKTVVRIIDYIRAGDIFQANLSQCFKAALPEDFDPYQHYLKLRSINPAPFAGYMNAGDKIIASASPERFLHCHNGFLSTKPIKGTAPRRNNPALLQKSAKDRAENIMIVDLMRNDFSRVCEAASIAVDKLCDIETFARVHHLVSTVTGRLRPNQSACDALAACFPGGSITGAPKIRAMEIIRELEKSPRGPYCGSMGYIGTGNIMDTNILIRTLVYQNNTVSFNAGGGITAASDPAAEYQETLDKAEAMFASFETVRVERKRA